MWERMRRLLRHRLALGWRHYLSEDAMQRVTARIAACEQGHSGEIRVCIESSLPQGYLLRDAPMRALVRQRALAQFARLRVWDTEHNNGVLIYLLLGERAIELVADRGIDARVPSATWEALVQALGAQLRSGQVEAGLTQAVEQVGALLAAHFPLAPGQANPQELPDRPDVGE